MRIKVKFIEDNSFDVRFAESSTQQVRLTDAIKGDKGDDGFSPIVEMHREDSATVLTITDKAGEHTARILDGEGAFPEVDNDTLIIQNGVMKVNTSDNAEPDNTKPITSGATYKIVGNIEVLLKTI